MAGIVTNRYLLLGLLDREPMSGYDIRGFLRQFNWLIGSPSYGGLYPALHRLVDDGLAMVEMKASPNGPTRKLYSITGKGQEVFQAWLVESASAEISLRDFVLLLLLAGNGKGSYERLLQDLNQRYAQVAAQSASLVVPDSDAKALTDCGDALASDYSRAIAEAELAWLEAARRRVERFVDD